MYVWDACDSMKSSGQIGINLRFVACARVAACSRVMSAAPVVEPDDVVANGRRETVFSAVGRRAGIRRDGRRSSSPMADELAFDEMVDELASDELSCVAHGRRAGNATVASFAFFLWSRLPLATLCFRPPRFRRRWPTVRWNSPPRFRRQWPTVRSLNSVSRCTAQSECPHILCELKPLQTR